MTPIGIKGKINLLYAFLNFMSVYDISSPKILNEVIDIALSIVILNVAVSILRFKPVNGDVIY